MKLLLLPSLTMLNLKSFDDTLATKPENNLQYFMHNLKFCLIFLQNNFLYLNRIWLSSTHQDYNKQSSIQKLLQITENQFQMY